MTIIDAINAVDRLKSNGYTQLEKIRWLSELDLNIQRSIIDTHAYGNDFNGYTSETPLDTELLADKAYEEMYIAWLEAKIDYYNNEYEKYNNSIVRFNDIFKEYQNWYNRTYPAVTADEKVHFRYF